MSLQNMVTRKLLATVVTIPLVLPKAKEVGEENDGQDWKRKKKDLVVSQLAHQQPQVTSDWLWQSICVFDRRAKH